MELPINQIIQGDCIAEMARLPDESIDFICTDLPYNITDSYWDKGIDLQKFWQEARRILKPCASAAMFASGNFVYTLQASNAEQYKYKWIWVKNQVTDFVNAKNRPMRKFEEILMFSKGEVAHVGKSKNRMNYYPQGLISCERHRDDTTKAGGGYTKQDSTQKKRVCIFVFQPKKTGRACAKTYSIFRQAAPFRHRKLYANSNRLSQRRFIL